MAPEIRVRRPVERSGVSERETGAGPDPTQALHNFRYRFADPPDVAWSRPATCGGGRMQLVQEAWLGGVSYQDSARVVPVLARVFTPLCAFAGGLVG